MGLSVVIPARNVAETLPAQLDALLSQEWGGPWEIVVVDNLSSDATAEVAQGYSSRDARVRVVAATNRAGLCYARDAGVRAARFDAIAICDGDDVVAPTWVRAMGEALELHQVVTGPLDVDRLNPPWLVGTRGRPSACTCATWFGLFPVVSGGNLGLRRDVWEMTGGFDEAFLGAEDAEFSLRLYEQGVRVHFEPEARVHYRYRQSFRDLWRQGTQYGLARPMVRRRVIELGLPAPSPVAGWKSWLWLVAYLPTVVTTTGRARWAWVAANRLGQVRGSMRARTVFV